MTLDFKLRMISKTKWGFRFAKFPKYTQQQETREELQYGEHRVELVGDCQLCAEANNIITILGFPLLSLMSEFIHVNS
jgi:hypothetical protein